MTRNAPSDYCETHDQIITETKRFIDNVLELNVSPTTLHLYHFNVFDHYVSTRYLFNKYFRMIEYNQYLRQDLQ